MADFIENLVVFCFILTPVIYVSNHLCKELKGATKWLDKKTAQMEKNNAQIENEIEELEKQFAKQEEVHMVGGWDPEPIEKAGKPK